MNLTTIDHVVITTNNLNACLHFYVDILGMQCDTTNGRYAVRFGDHKFNIHTRAGELLPAAEKPTPGSLDMCLIISGSLKQAREEVLKKGYPVETDILEKHGACGDMHSFYLRDPDGNLIEISSYA
ncbi:MAG: VOC family protein [Eubacteriales bacterium]|jgi:catechol 2,3-dioxygenase-like lactoylglutathione lyase family enzyme